MARERMAKLPKCDHLEGRIGHIITYFMTSENFMLREEHNTIVFSAPGLQMKIWSSQQDPPHFDAKEKNVLSKLNIKISRTKRKRHENPQMCPLMLFLQLAAQ